ncbi:MAG: hypothetical protein A2747_02225 [Candidatus Yonathbacteria bacterium RIFCSPHIGHO2_01_FULL_44_41]|uniref:Uncharacterized protein n=1 Tax=Candidatus Yonathbacteria bacterium RIFCSPHIGHO2_02_FULL_44_14 TaxID=1802724 RepID=A0A1G2S5V3_9BACT|nr:MAG: hypothetical protein A2747_02225 [Candidatus Yonathbacteria bacterium RIFCSPHIGHO2_01_FULL_44_41]OHA80436.1 MAG: hypothetical protein A3D51_03400 [Candidatus Yonathbacteria bacterium RIFCSPHIGHO2_02_FULL_44_14]OHA81690.1 MAG: hypothetical protein A3B06_02735 [Candidatus Yonathbacteria bacterium RIFCSPLOWO2_01_FULL_43_20]
MNQKTLIAIASLVILLIVGVGAYFYFTKKPASTLPTSTTFPGEGRPSTGFPATGTGGETGGGDAPAPGSSSVLPRLYELHKLPVAGVGFAETGRSPNRTISARYIERGLGHIFETPLETLAESRIVNETRSRIMEALWGNNGKSVVIRFVDEKEGGAIIKASILNLGGVSTSFARGTSTSPMSDFIKTEEVFLPDYIPFMATAEDGGDKLFYLENGVGVSRGSIATFKGLGVSTIFNSAFTEWLPQFPNQQLVTLTTKPSATVPGHLFFVDLKTKSVTKILGGRNGLTTLTSRNGKLTLFAEIKNGVPELSFYDVTKKVSHPLYLQTLPEKCVWGVKNTTLAYCAVPQTIPSATYPDQWYQGLVTFSDSMWEIDTTTFNTRKILVPSNLGAPALDIINLALSSNDAYLLFMNKVTGTPWVYTIAEPLLPKAEVSPSAITPDMQKLR